MIFRKTDPEELMLPSEVAKAFHVAPKTISRWARIGRIPPAAVIRTIGLHRRYKRAAIEALLRGEPWDGGAT